MLLERFRGKPNPPHCERSEAILDRRGRSIRLAMTGGAALFLALLAAPSFAGDNEPAMELVWAKLMPPAPPVQNIRSKSFLSGATPFAGAGGSEPPPPPMIDDKAWMSERRLQPGTGRAPAVVKELDGKRVRIGGYVVPLDFEATKVKEFLLVPFVGACIHVPPPPPNQIVYVKTEKGFDVEGSFDPVYVTGTLKVASQYTGLAETGYSIDADKVETRKE
ncbi:MAG: DUF3299 domain-containing protein [Rhodomicrobium sp.]